MTRFERVKSLNVDDLAWFVQTVIETTEQEMLEKLSLYGLEISMVTLDSEIRHAKIVNDLLEEEDGYT